MACLGFAGRGVAGIMGRITLNSVEKWFGTVQVIKGIDLDIDDGEFVVFVGPSGCGKSTLLRLIAGLEEISRGSLQLDSRDVTDQPPARRGLAMVFQSYALYPHMSVAENMGFSLKNAGRPSSEIKEKVDAAARILKLDRLLDRRPKELSGGQRQRVAIGRSIVRSPSAFLFDEPLSNLDAALRVEMRYEIAKLHQSLRSTMVYVTHDQVEAMTLANRIVVLDGGEIAQVGSPRQLYNFPGNLFVAQFIGSPKMNILECSTDHNAFYLEGGGQGHYDRNSPATKLGARPEHIEIRGLGEGQIDCTVDVSEYLGSDTNVIVDAGRQGKITVRVYGDSDLKPGDRVGLYFAPEITHFFDSHGQSVS